MSMNNLPKVYSYKLSRDFGFAPNPFHGLCTLATCKPQVRHGAQVGDIVIGCGSKKLKMPERIIFAMRVSEKITFQKYWDDPRFAVKKVNLHSGRAHGYGDNIYHLENEKWIQEDSHHSFSGGLINQGNIDRDLGSHNILVSDDFVYWGALAPVVPAHLRDLDGDDLYPNGRNFRCVFSDMFRAEVAKWFSELPERGSLGRPASWR